MQLWLVPGTEVNRNVRPPAACPYAGCGGRRPRLLQAVAKPVRGCAADGGERLGGLGRSRTGGVSGLSSSGLDGVPACPFGRARGLAAVRTVTVHRYVCRACGRTFRVYPGGVDRGDVAVGIKRFAAALHLLGLSFRDVSRALGVLGVPLGKSRVQAVVAPRLRGLRHRSVSMAPLLGRVVLGGATGDAVGKGSGGGGGGGGGGGDDDDAAAATVRVKGCDLTLRRALDARGRPALVIEIGRAHV